MAQMIGYRCLPLNRAQRKLHDNQHNALPLAEDSLLALRDYIDARLAARAQAAELVGFITQKPDAGGHCGVLHHKTRGERGNQCPLE